MKKYAEKYNKLAVRNYFDVRCGLHHSLTLVEKFLNVNNKKKLLDVGCGFGRYLKYFQNQGVICYGIDISSAQINKCEKYVRSERLQICNISRNTPNFNELFDYFIMMDVVEHVEDPVKAIKNIAKVINVGGVGLIVTPVFNLRGKFDFLIPIYRKILNVDAKEAGHEILFSEESLREVLGNDFEMMDVRYKNCVTEIMCSKLNRNIFLSDWLFWLSGARLFKPIMKLFGASIFIKVKRI